jgi:hypothetical protein
MKLTKAELEKENTEFKKLHQKLLKSNQDSMERRYKLSTANSNLLSENIELKNQISDLQKDLNEAKALLIQYPAENGNQGYKIEELTRRIEGLQIPTPQPKLTLFQQLKELFK